MLRLAATARHTPMPSQVFADLYARGQDSIAKHAGTDAAGLRARIIWAEVLEQMAAMGEETVRQEQRNLSPEERKTLERLWAQAQNAWQDYLLTEETRPGLAGFLDSITNTSMPLRDTAVAWEHWWQTLHHFCLTASGFADRDMALSKASKALQSYTAKHPTDPYAWLTWSKMLIAQGQLSSDPVVRMAFFDDAGGKYLRLLRLEVANRNTWLAWQQQLEELIKNCASPEECTNLQHRLQAFTQQMRQRFQ